MVGGTRRYTGELRTRLWIDRESNPALAGECRNSSQERIRRPDPVMHKSEVQPISAACLGLLEQLYVHVPRRAGAGSAARPKREPVPKLEVARLDRSRPRLRDGRTRLRKNRFRER